MQRVWWTYVVLCALLLAPPAESQEPPPLPSVDLGIHEFGFYPRLVSSRTDEDVWLVRTAKHASQVFRSSDAGLSWRVDEKAAKALEQPLLAGSSDTVSLLVWLSAEVGIAAGYMGPRVLRTTDAGRSWQAVPLTDDLWVYELERVGKRVWLCGSSGRIFRSDDAGASWRELKGSPFNGEDRCMAMSFLTPQDGWAVGRNGSVWATQDGGARWTLLKQLLPREDLQRLGLRHLVRLTPRIAWVQGEGGRFVTTDGGESWSSRHVTAGERHAARVVARTPEGQRIITLGLASANSPVEQWVPLLQDKAEAVAVRPDTVVALSKAGVSTYVSGQLVRAGPPVSRGSGVLTPLEGFVQKSRDVWLGWAGDRITASYDEGRSWFQVGRVPQFPVRALAFLKDKQVLAESSMGTLMRSEDLGRTWALSTSPLDAYDFARASGRAMPPGSPFDCVLTTPGSSMTVHFSNNGCFHAHEGRISITLSEGGAEIAGEYAQHERMELERKAISRDEGEFIIADLIAAATRQETGADCGSTRSYAATIEWACPAGGLEQGKVSFRASDCSLPPGIELPRPDSFSGYARAQGVHQSAFEAFIEAVP